MKFIPPGFITKDLHKSLKNEWRWEWCSERLSWRKMGRMAEKILTHWVSHFVNFFSKTICYKSNGGKALRLHGEDDMLKKMTRNVT